METLRAFILHSVDGIISVETVPKLSAHQELEETGITEWTFSSAYSPVVYPYIVNTYDSITQINSLASPTYLSGDESIRPAIGYIDYCG